MNNPTVNIIVALAKKNRLIGKNNQLPWYIVGYQSLYTKTVSQSKHQSHGYKYTFLTLSK